MGNWVFSLSFLKYESKNNEFWIILFSHEANLIQFTFNSVVFSVEVNPTHLPLLFRKHVKHATYRLHVACCKRICGPYWHDYLCTKVQ